MLPLTPERLDHLLAHSEMQSLSPDARQRLEWIAAYIRAGSSVSEICTRYKIARSTMHRWIKRFDPNDLSTLEEQTHAPITPRTSNVEERTIDCIREYRRKSPLMGKERIRVLLLQEHGVDVSSSTIGRIIEREGLYFAATPLHWKKRTNYRQYNRKSDAKDTTNQEIRGQRSEISTSIPTASHISTPCSCFWCTFRKTHGRGIRRTFALASIAINIVFLALYLATALWEQNNTQVIQADLTRQQTSIPHTISSLDGE